jgi:hypothetical protein
MSKRRRRLNQKTELVFLGLVIINDDGSSKRQGNQTESV